MWPFGRNKKSVLSLAPPEPVPAQVPTGFDAIRIPLGDRWSNHPGAGLTMRLVFEIYRMAELGYPRDQADLFEDALETDGTLRARVDSRVEAVAGKPWTVQAGGDDPEDLKAAAMLERGLRAVPTFNDTLAHLCMFNAFGYSASEILWDRVALDGETFSMPVWFANVPHRRLRFDVNDDRMLLLTLENPTMGEPLAPGKWITIRRRGRIAVMAGLMRTALFYSFYKRLSVRDMVIIGERFGSPFAIGTYPQGIEPKEKSALKKAVENLGKDGYAIMNETCKIVLSQYDGGKADSIQSNIVNLCNTETAKLFDGGVLAGDTAGASGGGSSYALGQVHADTRFQGHVSDAEAISLRFEQDIGMPFVKFNGLRARPPRLKIAIVREMDPLTRLKLYQGFQDMGGDVDAEQVRQEFQIKKPVGDTLKKPAPIAPPPSVKI